jgi:hypothetical protein
MRRLDIVLASTVPTENLIRDIRVQTDEKRNDFGLMFGSRTGLRNRSCFKSQLQVPTRL